MDGPLGSRVLSRANRLGSGWLVASIEIGLVFRFFFAKIAPKTAKYTIDLDWETEWSVCHAVFSGVFLRDQGSIQYMAQSYRPVWNMLKTGSKPVYTGTGSEPVFFRKNGLKKIWKARFERKQNLRFSTGNRFARSFRLTEIHGLKLRQKCIRKFFCIFVLGKFFRAKKGVPPQCRALTSLQDLQVSYPIDVPHHSITTK